MGLDEYHHWAGVNKKEGSQLEQSRTEVPAKASHAHTFELRGKRNSMPW